MTRDTKVVEDGVEPSHLERLSQGPSWFWLGVGFVIGLGVAIVFFTAGSAVPEETAEEVTFPGVDEPEETAQEQTPTSVTEPEGVGESVDGFPDTLLAATQSSGNLVLLTWPVAGPPLTTPIPGFASASVKFDTSGRLMAMSSPVVDSDLEFLSLGAPLRTRPVATDVSGYAWHDSEPGRLAYTQMVDGEWRLLNVDPALEPEVVTRGIGIEGHVATWGDWGYAIQNEGSITLLTAQGEFKAISEGRALDSRPDGWVVVSDAGLKLVSSGGGVNRLDAELDVVGEIEGARFSPDGTKLVVVGGGGHLIISLEDGDVIQAPVTSGFPRLAWTSDSRFVISPWIRGILIIDTERNGRSQTYLTRHVVIAVAAVPLTER